MLASDMEQLPDLQGFFQVCIEGGVEEAEDCETDAKAIECAEEVVQESSN